MKLDEVLQSLGIDPDSPVLDELEAQVAEAGPLPRRRHDHRPVNVGRNVTPTTPAFVLGDPDELEVVANIDASKGDTASARDVRGHAGDRHTGCKYRCQLTAPFASCHRRMGRARAMRAPSTWGWTRRRQHLSDRRQCHRNRTARQQGRRALVTARRDPLGRRAHVRDHQQRADPSVDVELGLQAATGGDPLWTWKMGQVVVGPYATLRADATQSRDEVISQRTGEIVSPSGLAMTNVHFYELFFLILSFVHLRSGQQQASL